MKHNADTIWAMIPGAYHPKLRWELSLAPADDREDMLQEAALAVLEGRNPSNAAETYRKVEHRHQELEVCEAKLGLDPERGSYADIP